jgi:hypothetical protein
LFARRVEAEHGGEVRWQRFASALSDIGDVLAEVEGLAGELEGEMGVAKHTLRTLEDENAHRRHLYLSLLARQVRVNPDPYPRYRWGVARW